MDQELPGRYSWTSHSASSWNWLLWDTGWFPSRGKSRRTKRSLSLFWPSKSFKPNLVLSTAFLLLNSILVLIFLHFYFLLTHFFSSFMIYFFIYIKNHMLFLKYKEMDNSWAVTRVNLVNSEPQLPRPVFISATISPPRALGLVWFILYRLTYTVLTP